MKLRNIWFVAELLRAANVIKNGKKNTQQWFRLKTAEIFLKSIGIARDLVIYQIWIMVCVIVLVFSAILMEAAFIFCLPISEQAKLTALFIAGGVNFAVTLSLMGYFLSAERWLRQAAKYNECVTKVAGNKL